MVLGPSTLLPGQFTNFAGSYIEPFDCCGPCVDTLTARGNEKCLGTNVMATASVACPRIITPRLTVTRGCTTPPPILGELVFFNGMVSNSGNATLANVTVTDDQAGILESNLVLAPGEAASFLGIYVVTNCGPSVPDGISTSGSDICTGLAVSNRFIASCAINCSSLLPPLLVNANTTGGQFFFSFVTAAGQTYTVQFTDSVVPAEWKPLTNFAGDGNLITIPDSMTNSQRFYRVLSP
jgi:uncharacterized repeat protein (TIGR01451 family)